MIPIFNVVLISSKDENAINNSIDNGKPILFHLWKCQDKLYGNIVLNDANWNNYLNLDFQNFLGSYHI